MTDTTKLAEKAAKWLGGKFYKEWRMDDFPGTNAQNVWVFPGEVNDATTELYFNDSDLVEFFLHDNTFSPILAHLAKRELAKRKLHWYASWKWDKQNERDIYFFQVIKDSSDANLIMEMDENEYKALWLAIEKTGVLDE